ncbi:MAG: M48 family metallopeptidase [Chthonomonadales bacterium]
MWVNPIPLANRRLFVGIACAGILAIPPARADISGDLERELGKAVSRELENTYGLVRDPVLTNYVESVGSRLGAVSGRTGVPYVFKVLDSDDVNATAAPYGHIYINRGTLTFVKSEDELAAVLGHEVGHVAGKHSIKQFNAQLISMLMLAGFRSLKSDTLTSVGGLAGGLAMLKFSRDEENDADRRGLKNAVATGYDGRKMADFLSRLGDEEKSKPTKFETYFLTHPPIPERVRRVSEEAGSKETANNAVALGDGQVARGLIGQAILSYKRAVALNPQCGADVKLASLLDKRFQMVPAQRLAASEKAAALSKLLELDRMIGENRSQWNRVDGKWAQHRKSAEQTLETAAQSLTEAGRYIGRYDTVQFKQFNRLAQSFENAAKFNAQLRGVRDTADAVFQEMTSIRNILAQSVDSGDAEAAKLVGPFVQHCDANIRALNAEMAPIERAHVDAERGARALRIASDSLVNSYKMPLGFTGGNFEIMDMQVISAGNDMKNNVQDGQKLISRVSETRMDSLVERTVVDLLHVDLQTPALSRIVSRYFGVEPNEVSQQLNRQGPDAGLRSIVEVAYTQAYSKLTEKDKAKTKGSAIESGKPAAENVTILLQLLSKDVENEVRAVR